MKWKSTRGSAARRSTSEAIALGLADDGGLFVPAEWPQFKIDPRWADLTFADFAASILKPFFAQDPLQKELPRLCTEAFNFPVPLVPVTKDLTLLELFHGPTGAFKDFGARFLALCCATRPPPPKPPLVLVATSGDTGGAVAAAFCEFTSIPVVILYPRGRVSPRQEKQLTVWGQQVQAFAVKGSFDDCQQVVKQALSSPWWQQRFNLVSANSINLGRLLPQMAYFAYASVQLQKTRGPTQFVIPSGNTGNAVAALWAQRVGFPLARVHFAHNANRAVADYFSTGHWSAQPTQATLANAMDVGNPSNFERARDLYPEWNELKQNAHGHTVTDAQIRQTLVDVFTERRQILCPHSATAYHVAAREAGMKVVVATAHPAKFETLVEPLLNTAVPVPPRLEHLFSLEGQSTDLASTLTALQEALKPMGA